MKNKLPLDGIRVLDLSRVLAGPFCTQALGDLGAEIIKVEHPSRGDDTRDWGDRIGQTETTYFNSVNRNKKSIAIDLQKKDGVDLIYNLIKSCDVLIHNFKVGGVEKIGLDYEKVKKINNKIIYCSISGYGSYSKESKRPGYDLVIQAESGLMTINGDKNMPPLKFGVAVVDMVTGMYASQAILAALVERNNISTGKKIEVSLYECGASISAYYGLDSLHKKINPIRVGNGHPSIVPYGLFSAKDGSLIIAVGNNSQFEKFCRSVINRADILENEKFKTNLNRTKNREELLSIIKHDLLNFDSGYLLSKMHELGIPCGTVNGLYDGLSGERSKSINLTTKVSNKTAEDFWIFNPPYWLDDKKVSVRKSPPSLGEDTQEIALDLLHLKESEIEKLKQMNVIK